MKFNNLPQRWYWMIFNSGNEGITVDITGKARVMEYLQNHPDCGADLYDKLKDNIVISYWGKDCKAIPNKKARIVKLT